MTKKDRKAEAAARARALLGLGDEDGPKPVEPAPRADVPKPTGGRNVGGSVPRPEPMVPARDNGPVEAGRTRAKAGRKLPPVPSVPSLSEDDAPRPGGQVVLAPPTQGQVGAPDGAINPKHFPKKHLEGSLKRGDSVWYRGERFYIEFCPPTWGAGCYARICAWRVDANPERASGTDLGEKCHASSFCVHADLLAVAPVAKNVYAAQPTLAGVARKERAARGEKDVGDDIAVLLRACAGLDDVYRAGAKYLSVQESELRSRYGHLNAGQQRMNIGNRMRAQWRKSQK